MTATSYVFGILSAALILVVVVELLRRRHLRERHAVWWFVAGVLALIVGIFPATLEWAAKAIGIEVPTNLVFFAGITVVVLVCLQHSSELTQLESKTRTLAERLALSELRLKELEDRNSPGTTSSTKDPRPPTP
ncbi:MAG: hypothetical protein JWM50_112 [Microbacteriaceae bacterium]|jgi:hypothetical protein|nr:hypothetical protein [Microbacteriaceae bacterium]